MTDDSQAFVFPLLNVPPVVIPEKIAISVKTLVYFYLEPKSYQARNH